ncbi:MAG TPA: hypothetical protein VK465_18975, partial [Fibrobacteria bacterium]|nr:hypothetical protein [Fibrobacteria bacterium]
EVAVSLAPAALETLGAVATALADIPEPARPSDFEEPPEARSNTPAAAPRIEPTASTADEEETDPASEDLDYSEDPEDPDMQALPPGTLPVPHPRPGAREEGPVPQQPGPEHLPRLWPALVDELMATRPLLATHLRLSRLEWEREGSAGLTLVFLDRAAYSLLADDGDFRKSILAFLTSKLSANREFPLRHHLDEAAAASAEPVTLATLEEARADEPILSYIRRLFEGRPV